MASWRNDFGLDLVLELERFSVILLHFSWWNILWLRNEKGILPEVPFHFHWRSCLLWWCYRAFFMLLMIGYAKALQTPALPYWNSPQKKSIKVKERKRVPKKRKTSKELSSSLIWGEKKILFLAVFGSMCFAAMVQLSFGLRDYRWYRHQAMMIMIGLILSFSILFVIGDCWCSRESLKPWQLLQQRGRGGGDVR